MTLRSLNPSAVIWRWFILWGKVSGSSGKSLRLNQTLQLFWSKTVFVSFTAFLKKYVFQNGSTTDTLYLLQSLSDSCLVQLFCSDWTFCLFSVDVWFELFHLIGASNISLVVHFSASCSDRQVCDITDGCGHRWSGACTPEAARIASHCAGVRVIVSTHCTDAKWRIMALKMKRGLR